MKSSDPYQRKVSNKLDVLLGRNKEMNIMDFILDKDNYKDLLMSVGKKIWQGLKDAVPQQSEQQEEKDIKPDEIPQVQSNDNQDKNTNNSGNQNSKEESKTKNQDKNINVFVPQPVKGGVTKSNKEIN